MPNTKKIIIADKHEVICFGLDFIFQNQSKQLQIVEALSFFSALIEKVAYVSCDCLLLDLELNDGNCLHRIPELLSVNAKLKILLFVSQDDEQVHLHALRLGVSGIVLKNAPISTLIEAIDRVANGQLWFERGLTQLFLRQPISDNDKIISVLSEKERVIACLASKGVPAKAIANEVFLTEKTIRNHLTTIYAKLNVKNQVALCFNFSQFPFCHESCSRSESCPDKKG